MPPAPYIGGFGSQFAVIAGLWWIWVPLILFLAFVNAWLAYRRALYKARTPKVLLEILIPREIKKTPKAMEQVLAGIYGLKNTADSLMETYWDGEVSLWFSLELASFGGDLHFYIWTPAKHRNIVESLFYAHYQDIEIIEVPDYMSRVPGSYAECKRKGLELYGTELILAKDDAYPIRTYIDFESPAEEEQLDPISALLEVMGKIKKDEVVLLQILIRPAGTEWQRQGLALVEQLRKSKPTKTKVIGTEEITEMFSMRTPGETDVLKAVERNVSKPGFDCIIRSLYYAPKGMWDFNFAKRGVFSCFNQYASLSLNFFRNNNAVRTVVYWSQWPHLFPRRRLELRRARLLSKYRQRKMPEETLSAKLVQSSIFSLDIYSSLMTFNTEELATIWHLPSSLVLTGPLIKRVESRKVGPPAGLPIFGAEEKDLPWKQEEK